MNPSKTTLARKKAILLSAGMVYIPPDMVIPEPSSSVSGPSAGNPSIYIELQEGSGKCQLHLKISEDARTQFSLNKKGTNINLLKNKRIFHPSIRLIPKIVHSPTHVFITIDPNCIYNCLFCNSAGLNKVGKSIDEILRLVASGVNNGTKSVALTSGVIGSPTPTTEVVADVVSRIRTVYPKITIGVELYIENARSMEILKKAGASEMKINVQSSDKTIFWKVCSRLDYNTIFDRLQDAVKIFGKGKVCSNIIIGFGETDKSVLDCVIRLAKMGVVATIRPIALDKNNINRLKRALGSKLKRPDPDRLLYLAKEQKKILSKYGLTTRSFRTMCHACTCCDIVPFVDL